MEVISMDLKIPNPPYLVIDVQKFVKYKLIISNGVKISDKNTNISKFINIEFKSSLIKKDVKRDVIITTESTKIRIETLLDLDKLFINLFI